MRQSIKLSPIIIIILSIITIGCSDKKIKENKSEFLFGDIYKITNTKSTATGMTNKVLVYFQDSLFFDSKANILLDYMADQDFMVTAIAEPSFSINYMPISLQGKMFNSSKIVFNLKIGKENTFAIKKDIYSAPQMVLEIVAKDYDNMASIIKKYMHLIQKEIRKNDLRAYFYSDDNWHDTVPLLLQKNKMGIYIPKYFLKARNTDSIFWYRHFRKNDDNVNIWGAEIAYDDLLEKEKLIQKRNELGKKYIHGSTDREHLKTDPIIPPIFYAYKTKHNIEIIEMRGLWEMENVSMGGSFISYFVLNHNTKKAFFIEGFVYAPNTGYLRKQLLRIESILKSMYL